MNDKKSKTNLLNEQYEDALFALLMDDFTESNGQLLIDENERLLRDQNFKLPKGLEERCENAINEAFTVKRKELIRHKAKTSLKRIAIVFLLCGITFISLYSNVSAFREAVCNIAIRDKGVSTDIYISGANESIPKGAYTPKWLPDGYELASYEKRNTDASAMFCNTEDNRIYYYEYRNDEVGGVDKEDADSVEKIKINNFDGILITKDNLLTITWADTNRNIIARLKAKNIDKTTAIKIANSVEPN